MAPTLRRLKKVARISMIFEGILFLAISLGCYWILGDKYTPDLVIVRTYLNDKDDIF